MNVNKLSEHFNFEEMIRTQQEYPNLPGPAEAEKLFYVCNFILEPIRIKFGRIYVTSGFRSKIVNELVGGSNTSQHMKGEAADFYPMDTNLEAVFRWIVFKSGFPFGQCIFEKSEKVIHISMPRLGKTNNEALIKIEGSFQPFDRGEHEG